MADIVLLNQNGNPFAYEGVNQIKIPNADGGETTYTNLEELHPYYVKFVNSTDGLVKVVSYGLAARYANAVVCMKSYVDEDGETCLTMLTSRDDLVYGETYKLSEL